MLMRRTRVRVLFGLGAASCAAVWLIADMAVRAGAPVPVPWPVVLMILAAAVFIGVNAWPIRRHTRGAGPAVRNPLRAARVWALTRACSHGGALLTGAFLGVAASYAPDAAIDSFRDRLFIAVFVSVASLVLAVTGYVTETWCRIDPERPETDGKGSAAATPD